MWDKVTNKNCKTFFCYFPLFFGNVCLGAQYLDKILLITIIIIIIITIIIVIIIIIIIIISYIES